MGLMQTAQSLSGAIGPAVGGFVGDVVGFRYAFMGSAVVLASVTAAVQSDRRVRVVRGRLRSGRSLVGLCFSA
jgi:predicted MFS family arabinose efflux permease